MNVGEISGKTMEFIMSKIDSEGIKFSDECMEILTLCISELIKASFCKSHYTYAIDKAINLIKEDFNELCKNQEQEKK